MTHRENKKRGREVTEDKTIQVNSEKCAKKIHPADNNTRPHHHEFDEHSVFDFPWIKDGTMFSPISEEDLYLEGTFLSSLRSAAIEGEGESFIQFSCIATTGGLFEFVPEIVDGDDNGVCASCSIPTVDSNGESLDPCIWASVLNQPIGRV